MATQPATREYMLLLRGGASLASVTPAQAQQTIQKYMNWINQLRAKGQFKAGDPLEDGVKFLSGKGGCTVTDGPFAESKEAVGGYFLINARDLDEAVAIAKGCPIFDNNGTVEVRAIELVPGT